MASYDSYFRLDTDAYTRARRERTARTSLYWLMLILAACAIAAGFAILAGRVLTPGSGGATSAQAPLAPPPPPAETHVAVWNLRGAARPAARLAASLHAAGYALGPVRRTHAGRVHGTWVMYARDAKSAALGVARRLGVKASRVAPLDGVDPARIAPATVLVLLGP